MDEKIKSEMKSIIISEWDKYELKQELAKMVEYGYIFGPYANNLHFNIDEIWEIVKEVESEKNPVIELIE